MPYAGRRKALKVGARHSGRAAGEYLKALGEQADLSVLETDVMWR